jgi:hypothetical protein
MVQVRRSPCTYVIPASFFPARGEGPHKLRATASQCPVLYPVRCKAVATLRKTVIYFLYLERYLKPQELVEGI